jgi:type II secretory pathway pseudopilin PulG
MNIRRNIFIRRRAFTLTELAIVIGISGAALGGIWAAWGHASQSKKVTQAGSEIRFIVTKIHSLSYNNPKLFSSNPPDPGCTVKFTVCPPSSCALDIPIMPPAPTCPAGPPCGVGCHDPSAGCIGGISHSSGTTDADASNAAMAGIFPSEMISGTAPVVSSPWGNGDVSLNVSVGSNECVLPSYLAALTGLSGEDAITTAQAATPTPHTVINNIDLGNNAGAIITFGSKFTLTYAAMPVAACVQILSTYSSELVSMGLTSLSVGSYGFTTPTVASTVMTLPNIVGWCSGPGTGHVPLALTFPIQLN